MPIEASGVSPDAAPQARLGDQAFAPGPAAVTLDEPEHITPGQTAVQCRVKESAEILHQPALRYVVANLNAMQVNQEKLQRLTWLPFWPGTILDKEVAEIKVSMVQSGFVQGAGNAGNPIEQRALEQLLARAVQPAPIAREVFEMNHSLQRLGDEERLDVRWRSPSFAFAYDDGRRDAELLHAFVGFPFGARADNGRA